MNEFTDILPMSSWLPVESVPFVIAGPCSAESEEQVLALFNNFERKKKTTEYLRMAPIRDYFGN